MTAALQIFIQIKSAAVLARACFGLGNKAKTAEQVGYDINGARDRSDFIDELR